MPLIMLRALVLRRKWVKGHSKDVNCHWKRRSSSYLRTGSASASLARNTASCLVNRGNLSSVPMTTWRALERVFAFTKRIREREREWESHIVPSQAAEFFTHLSYGSQRLYFCLKMSGFCLRMCCSHCWACGTRPSFGFRLFFRLYSSLTLKSWFRRWKRSNCPFPTRMNLSFCLFAAGRRWALQSTLLLFCLFQFLSSGFFFFFLEESKVRG